jgi:hypothetical protein
MHYSSGGMTALRARDVAGALNGVGEVCGTRPVTWLTQYLRIRSTTSGAPPHGFDHNRPAPDQPSRSPGAVNRSEAL